MSYPTGPDIFPPLKIMRKFGIRPGHEFSPQPKQFEIADSQAPLRLAVGGVRSGKTTGAIMYAVWNYCLMYDNCDILVLRRTFRELEAGAITDLKTFFQGRDYKPVFDWNDSKHIAKFDNGSRVFFGSCTNNKERDIEQYLGQGYPFILLDECAQFSPDAFELLQARNTVNVGCTLGEFGRLFNRPLLPTPMLWGCTNPIGPFWLYYKTLFVDKKPVGVDGATRDPDGRWWVDDLGERRCVYNPRTYICVHSTVLDNQAILKRDPGIVARLNNLPPAKREKLLYGLLDRVEGQYFDSFNSAYHVLNLREDPDAVIWQPHQPVWAGWDWGMGHHNALYIFTRALVRRATVPGAEADYKLKTVCFREIVVNPRDERMPVDQQTLVSLLAKQCFLPNAEHTKFRMSAIYFSHEKFNRQLEQHSPADVLSALLRAINQPNVTPATRDRIGRASFLYNLLQMGDLFILDTCPEIINALPALQRDPDQLDDVLKVDNKADDCYDGFSYGLFGQLAPRKKSREVAMQEKIDSIADPFVRYLTRFKMTMDAQAERRTVPFDWQRRLRDPDGKAIR